MKALLALLLAVLPPAQAADLSLASQNWFTIKPVLPPAAEAPSLGTREVYHISFESLIDAADPEEVRKAAEADPGLKVLVDKAAFTLRVMRGQTLLYKTRVAVGSGKTFVSNGRTFVFDTPVGKRVVKAKQADPLWTPPDWHYYERGAALKLEVVKLERGKPCELSDGRVLEIRGREVGVVDGANGFLPILLGEEIVFEGKLFIPPFGTEQRSIEGVLGPYKLDLGSGVLIHGTNKGTAGSIGTAASHGCVRVANDELGEVYDLVPVGTPVYIY